MTVGPRPFVICDRQLAFAPRPLLPGQWFTENAVHARWNEKTVEIPGQSFACAFLGDILLIYHNPSRKNTYGPSAAVPVKYILDGRQEIVSSMLSGPLAEQIRERKFQQIDIWLE